MRHQGSETENNWKRICPVCGATMTFSPGCCGNLPLWRCGRCGYLMKWKERMTEADRYLKIK